MSVRNFRLRRDIEGLVLEDDLIVSPLMADVVAPPLYVEEVSAEFNKLPTGETLKVGQTKRNNDGTFNRGTHQYTKGSYTTEEYGWEEPSDNVQRLTNLKFYDDQIITSQICNSVVLLGRELRVATALQTVTNYPAANRKSSACSWKIKDAASPKADIKTLSDACFASFGMLKRSLELVITYDAIDAAMETDEVRRDSSFTLNLDEYNYEQAAGYLKMIWGLAGLTPVSSVFNAAGIGGSWEGTQMWSPDTMILRLPASKVQTWRIPNFARQPVYTPFARDRRFETNENWDNDSTIARVREYRGLYADYTKGCIMSGIYS